jgi:signal transduction histidine kinase
MSSCLAQLDHGDRARERNELRTALVDSVTHELRTPLASIKASVTFVARRLAPVTIAAPRGGRQGTARRFSQFSRPAKSSQPMKGKSIEARGMPESSRLKHLGK